MKRILFTIFAILLSLNSYAQVTSYTARRFVKFTGAPSNPQEGDVYENLTSHAFFFYNGTTFQQLAAVNGALGNATATTLVIGTGTSRQTLDVYPASAGTEIHFSSTDVDSGGYLTSTAANQFIVSGGALLTGGNWVAKATSASIMQAAGGFFTVYGDTGLTIGNNFTPTQLFQITSTGGVTAGAITATSLNGNTFTTGTYTLTGTAAKTLTFQNSLTLAGTDGTVVTFPPNSASVPGRIAVIDLTTQAAAITATSLYAVPANGAGVYRACWVATVTRAATTSSTLGGTAGFQLTYTDNDDSVVKTTAAAGAPSAGVNQAYSQTNQGNTTATQASGCVTVFAKASTTINYLFGYTSSGATTMQYNLHIRLYYEQ